jgi:hypothetical protein
MPNEEDYPLEVYEDEDDEALWLSDNDDTEDGGENFFDYTSARRLPKGPCSVQYL